MKLKRIKINEDIKPFDCGDADLNGFLLDDAVAFHSKHIGKTFVIEDEEEKEILAYFCLLNDKITKIEASNSAWKKVKKLFFFFKHFNSYPAVKIGRLAVSTKFKSQGIGSKIIWLIKVHLRDEITLSDFRFLTVDAYLSAVPFYEKNDFKFLDAEDKNKHTRLMFFDMNELY